MRQILEGARRVFLADGFDGASMNDVARVAGVSKGTLYVYFQSKQALFEALIREEHRRTAERLSMFDEAEPDVALVLTRFGNALMNFMLLPEHIALVRTVSAAAAKFPAIGRAFFDAGPQYGADRLAAYFSQQVEAGALFIDDVNLAAWQFLEALQGGHLKRMLFCVCEPPQQDAVEKAVARAVEMFMAVYRPK
ncbi:MAG: TetR/AcrR family transcriptional regulator [Methylobacteriaceae bacterium]|nr:TetR/AcrR family transcriptional regulator [Methylobacteriaceae bacterium]